MSATISVDPLMDQVAGILHSSPYLSPQQVRVANNQGKVRLEGTVRSYFQKQMAQELVRRVDGVEGVENQLQVNWR
jgi:osmotically-inducible protein OsmY